METLSLLEKAKSFLKQNQHRLALRAVPMALVAVAAAHASPTFNAPNNTSVVKSCPSGGGIASGSLAGSATSSGLGLALSGSASLNHSAATETCTYTLKWQGTGSGTFGGTTATVHASFSITPAANSAITGYNLSVLINGATQKTIACTTGPVFAANARRLTAQVVAVTCSGQVDIPTQNFNVPPTLSSYEVDLLVNALWTNSASGTIAVGIPSNSTIDILAQATVAPPTVPALSPFAMLATALLLVVSALGLSRVGASAPRT